MSAHASGKGRDRVGRAIALIVAVMLIVAASGCGTLLPPSGGRVAPNAQTPPVVAAQSAEATTAFESAAAAVSRVVVNVGVADISGSTISSSHPTIPSGNGSGIIIRSDGYILTNDHVVSGAASITVSAAGADVPARVVGRDESTDLAVIKVDRSGLATAQIGDSRTLRPGQWVIAVGSPFGLERTVTTGIVSAVNRASPDPSGVGASTYTNLIQTDAAINPGNSGGALATLDGKVVGVNSLGEGPTGASTGVSFAIPIEFAIGIADQLIKSGKAVHPYLGLDVMTMSPHVASLLGIDATGTVEGAFVSTVASGSPGAVVGIEHTDVITSLGGIPTPDAGSYYGALRNQSIGATVPVTFVREDATRTVEVRVGQK